MRGSKIQQGELLSALTPDDLGPADHPIRRIRVIVDAALEELHGDFEAMYSRVGRPSIAPERLTRGLTPELCGQVSPPGSDPARGAAQHQATQCDRSSNHTARGVRAEPAGAQTGRGDLWLAEDGGRGSQAAVHRAATERAVDAAHAGDVQRGANGELGAGGRLSGRIGRADRRQNPAGEGDFISP